MTNELRSCPFCGSKNVKLFYDEEQNYHVECYGCTKTISFHIAKGSSWVKAVEIWNTRALLPAAKAVKDYCEHREVCGGCQVQCYYEPKDWDLSKIKEVEHNENI